jgi:hypothetical protein
MLKKLSASAEPKDVLIIRPQDQSREGINSVHNLTYLLRKCPNHNSINLLFLLCVLHSLHQEWLKAQQTFRTSHARKAMNGSENNPVVEKKNTAKKS